MSDDMVKPIKHKYAILSVTLPLLVNIYNIILMFGCLEKSHVVVVPFFLSSTENGMHLIHTFEQPCFVKKKE